MSLKIFLKKSQIVNRFSSQSFQFFIDMRDKQIKLFWNCHDSGTGYFELDLARDKNFLEKKLINSIPFKLVFFFQRYHLGCEVQRSRYWPIKLAIWLSGRQNKTGQLVESRLTNDKFALAKLARKCSPLKLNFILK